MCNLRYYQRDAVEAVYEHLRTKDTNPCVVIPTAGGKSICIAEVAKDAVQHWGGRVLILAHVKELVEQNAGKITAICPELKVGVYSAGLNRRDTKEPVIVAGIQSVYNKLDEFEPFDIVMVDEVHLVPPDGEGRYRTFLNGAKAQNPNVRLVGWTATPYRTQGGLICKPENLFNEICYEISIKKLIDEGFISKVTAHAGKNVADTSALHIRAGEFMAEDVEKLMGEERLVSSACREIVELTKDRQACLIFCTSLAHCKKVAALIKEYSGEECAIVSGDTPDDEREATIRRLRGETVQHDLFGEGLKPLKYACNVSVLTTGTDIPRLDTIALLRPTNSAGLLVQMIGRGFRLSPETGKSECLILDYGRNIERFGPIDLIGKGIVERTAGNGEKGPLAKTCPQCRNLVGLPVMLCPECGYEFPRKDAERRSHEAQAARTAILSGEVTVETHNVSHVDYQVWEKRGAPPDAPKTVRITYYFDMLHSVSEWLCPEHRGYARSKFERWWQEHGHHDAFTPVKAEDVCELEFMGMIREVKSVTIRRVSGEKYPEVVGYELGEFPLERRIGEGGISGEEGFEEDIDDLPF